MGRAQPRSRYRQQTGVRQQQGNVCYPRHELIQFGRDPMDDPSGKRPRDPHGRVNRFRGEAAKKPNRPAKKPFFPSGENGWTE